MDCSRALRASPPPDDPPPILATGCGGGAGGAGGGGTAISTDKLAWCCGENHTLSLPPRDLPASKIDVGVGASTEAIEKKTQKTLPTRDCALCQSVHRVSGEMNQWAAGAR